MERQIIQLEQDMWEAVLCGDVHTFQNLVSPNAVMICGGYRCLGSEYAAIMSDFHIQAYTIRNMEVIDSEENEVILHYIIKIEVEDKDDKDLEGLFHVVSIWKKRRNAWKLVLNMDSRINGEYAPPEA